MLFIYLNPIYSDGTFEGNKAAYGGAIYNSMEPATSEREEKLCKILTATQMLATHAMYR